MPHRRRALAGAIVASGLLIAAGVFAFPNQRGTATSPQWTQTVGSGILAPACGSASNQAPTCSGSAPSITFDWVQTDIHADNIRLTIVRRSDGVTVFDQLICAGCSGSGSYTWDVGTSNTIHDWTINGGTAVADIYATGSFTTLECRPNLTVQSPTFTPVNPVAGNPMSFSGTVKNVAASGTAGPSQTRFQLDRGNNGSWDVTPANNATGALGPNANEVETWSNVWNALVGQHRYEICADVTNTVAESDENDNCVSPTFSVATSGNQAPVAVATISGDGTNFADSITVSQGQPVSVWLSAAGSSDPDGWTHPTNGVSSGGRCEWNGDLAQGSFTAQPNFTVTNPASPTSCDATTQAMSKTFNDPPGTYTYQVLRITDAAGAASTPDTVSVTVQAPVTPGPGSPSPTPPVTPGPGGGNAPGVTPQTPSGGGVIPNAGTPAFGENPAGACNAPLQPTLSWVYSDPDGDPQAAYQIQIDDDASFSSPVLDTGKTPSATNSYTVAPGILAYATLYHWRVEVWDSTDLASGWTNGPSFTTQSVPPPNPDYGWTPINPNPNQNTFFSPVSQGLTYSYDWAFQDGVPATATIQSPQVRFQPPPGSKTSSLIITQSSVSCGVQKLVPVGGSPAPPPLWQEIKPQ